VITAHAGKRVAGIRRLQQRESTNCSVPGQNSRWRKSPGLPRSPWPVRGRDSKKVDRGRSQSTSAGLAGQGVIRAPGRRADSLKKGDGRAAVAILEPRRRYERANDAAQRPLLDPLYARESPFAVEGADKAARVVSEDSGFSRRDATRRLIPMAQLHLARAYAMQNDSVKARTAPTRTS